MNSLNILSAIGSTPPPSPTTRSRSASEGDIYKAGSRTKARRKPPQDDEGADSEPLREKEDMRTAVVGADVPVPNGDTALDEVTDEKAPLLGQPQAEPSGDTKLSTRWLSPRRLMNIIIGALKVVLSSIVAPGRYVIACFYDDHGHFSAKLPITKVGQAFSRKRRRSSAQRVGMGMAPPASPEKEVIRPENHRMRPRRSARRSPSQTSNSTFTSDSEREAEHPGHDTPSMHTRSRSRMSFGEEEIAPAKRSIKIKLHNEEVLRQRKERKPQLRGGNSAQAQLSPEDAAAEALKSPMMPAPSTKLTKFPRAPAPPRPLIPRRQASYTTTPSTKPDPNQKTLIIDLDETLIHSMSRGGRFTTGHMVEVRLSQAMGTGGMTLAPQVPILYYVHKRPHCDEFLKKVCKWYKLIIFTASVQEYADPVIDWLESERKYFAGRYYRQHCTFRAGMYIKDLSQVEPDLSKVMIVDNSPHSYAFHEDNAIPIEGWISDPTDNDLLHLIPLLEGLQYVTDVRALLALRKGEPQAM